MLPIAAADHAQTLAEPLRRAAQARPAICKATCSPERRSGTRASCARHPSPAAAAGAAPASRAMGCSSSAPEDDAARRRPSPGCPGSSSAATRASSTRSDDEPSSRRSSAPASDSGLASSHASDDALLLPDSEIQSRLLSIGRRASEDELRPPTRLYRVPSKENVELMAEHMQLYVSTKSGVITLLDVAPTDTVLDVKKKLHSKGAVSARKRAPTWTAVRTSRTTWELRERTTSSPSRRSGSAV